MFPGVIWGGYCQSGACQEEQLSEMHGYGFDGKGLFWMLIGKGVKDCTRSLTSVKNENTAQL